MNTINFICQKLTGKTASTGGLFPELDLQNLDSFFKDPNAERKIRHIHPGERWMAFLDSDLHDAYGKALVKPHELDLLKIPAWNTTEINFAEEFKDLREDPDLAFCIDHQLGWRNMGIIRRNVPGYTPTFIQIECRTEREIRNLLIRIHREIWPERYPHESQNILESTLRPILVHQ